MGGICRLSLAHRWVWAYTNFMHYSRRTIEWFRTIITNIITVGVATGLAMNRWRNREIVPREWPVGRDAPYIQIIAPMRNEAENVRPLLATLRKQRYPGGRWGVTIVDDASTDVTKHIAEEIAARSPELTVVAASPLPEGWTGKSNAMYAGYQASPQEAEWLLFVDADTRHEALMLASVIRSATDLDADLMSLIIDVKMESFWEYVIVPQVGELYTLLVGTMDQVNTSKRGQGTAAANGQFLLIKRDLYGKFGALAEVRSDVAEDRALAGAMKAAGHNVRLEYGRSLVSARVYSTLNDMWNGYAKTLFWASGHITEKAITVVAALTLYALLPPVALLVSLRGNRVERGAALTHAALRLIPMLAVRVAVCRQMGIPARYALTYPLGVAVGNAMLLYSMYRVLSGKGVRWKGRTYR